MKLVKYIRIAFSMGAVACGIFYLIFAFGNWSWSPKEWGESARAGYSIACCFILIVAAGIAISLSDD